MGRASALQSGWAASTTGSLEFAQCAREVKAGFSDLADLTRAHTAPPLSIAHCIRDLGRLISRGKGMHGPSAHQRPIVFLSKAK